MFQPQEELRNKPTCRWCSMPMVPYGHARACQHCDKPCPGVSVLVDGQTAIVDDGRWQDCPWCREMRKPKTR